ncbi:MAG: hypothetical protein FWE67_16535, partial [Planctomycetaceae bacterium]|nr:hypothetical protein [Planctomycetaceae bacterium]
RFQTLRRSDRRVNQKFADDEFLLTAENYSGRYFVMPPPPTGVPPAPMGTIFFNHLIEKDLDKVLQPNGFIFVP